MELSWLMLHPMRMGLSRRQRERCLISMGRLAGLLVVSRGGLVWLVACCVVGCQCVTRM